MIQIVTGLTVAAVNACQVGFLFNFHCYVNAFAEDIRYHEKSTDIELKRCLIRIIELHLSIYR